MNAANEGVTRTPADVVPIRDAAAVILMREAKGTPQVLMGQRGAKAVFMPNMFVFPGGAVDPEDLTIAEGTELDPDTSRRLCMEADPGVARALPLTAIRELWEETGLTLGRADPGADGLSRTAPKGWRGFLAAGLVPHGSALRFVFRAITPPGRPRRFDARFFLADAGALPCDPENFVAASGELSHLQWLDLRAARDLSLPFITEVVLSEVEALVAGRDAARPVPFFHHTEAGSHFRLL